MHGFKINKSSFNRVPGKKTPDERARLAIPVFKQALKEHIQNRSTSSLACNFFAPKG